MKKMYDYAFIGGDKRQVYMALGLVKMGYKVITYGLKLPGTCAEVFAAESMKEAVQNAKVIIGPIPLSRDQKTILGEEKPDMKVDGLEEILGEEQLFFAGCIPDKMLESGREKNIFMYDYMKNEEITIFNTIATAEGAVAEAIQYSPLNLQNSKCLVLGYGRCAKTLAAKLQGFLSETTVCARKQSALAEAKAFGFRTLELKELKLHIDKYDFIFNTIPNLILDKELLKRAKKKVLIIDIASAPGGVDFKEAEKLGISARLSLGLPGRYAPGSSAEALTEMTLSAVKEKLL